MKIVHCKRESYDVYIGRPSKWGNPYSHLPNSAAKFRTDTRERAIELYEKYIRENDDLLSSLHEIAGKTLGCWCSPKSCHGEILIKLCLEMNLIGPLHFVEMIDRPIDQLEKAEAIARNIKIKKQNEEHRAAIKRSILIQKIKTMRGKR